MNRDEIQRLEAGRELDALVAEKVMKLNCKKGISWKSDLSAFGGKGEIEFDSEFTIEREWVQEGDYVIVFDDGQLGIMPAYSTDIAAAWEVVEQLETMRPDILTDIHRISHNGERSGLQWAAHMRVIGGEGKYIYELAETVPIAICRAALLAVMDGDE